MTEPFDTDVVLVLSFLTTREEVFEGSGEVGTFSEVFEGIDSPCSGLSYHCCEIASSSVTIPDVQVRFVE